LVFQQSQRQQWRAEVQMTQLAMCVNAVVVMIPLVMYVNRVV
jgi:hypothetical protein